MAEVVSEGIVVVSIDIAMEVCRRPTTNISMVACMLGHQYVVVSVFEYVCIAHVLQRPASSEQLRDAERDAGRCGEWSSVEQLWCSKNGV